MIQSRLGGLTSHPQLASGPRTRGMRLKCVSFAIVHVSFQIFNRELVLVGVVLAELVYSVRLQHVPSKITLHNVLTSSHRIRRARL
jgi:hypothetical protein